MHDDPKSDEAAPSLGSPPERLTLDADVVRRLVAEQFPQWAALPVAPVENPGWDNLTFHLGDHLLVRLPSAPAYAEAVDKEHTWLPRLAARLPVPIPQPLGRGRPGLGYPLPWSVYAWLPGETADRADLDALGMAEDLAAFLAALRTVDTAEGPRPGVHNWHRGGPLLTFDEGVRRDLAVLHDRVDVGGVEAAWEHALAAPWDGEDTWFHGDVAAGNLLVEHGRLSAVIDFGTCGVGDPSCDLAICWTLLSPPGRELLRERLHVDPDEWSRGRGWALWKALRELVVSMEKHDEVAARHHVRVVEDVVADHRQNP